MDKPLKLIFKKLSQKILDVFAPNQGNASVKYYTIPFGQIKKQIFFPLLDMTDWKITYKML